MELGEKIIVQRATNGWSVITDLRVDPKTGTHRDNVYVAKTVEEMVSYVRMIAEDQVVGGTH